MGEIGIPRREFLYDLQLWEVRRIIRGYRRRDILKYQLMRLNAYMSCFAFRENKYNKTPEAWLPFDFEEEEEGQQMPAISKEDFDDLRATMRMMNKRAAKKKSK